MSKRTRKSPEKKKKPTRHVLGLLSAGVAVLARLAGRHPRLVGGLATFGVIFGTVAANALWYQPGQHPSPFLRTRDAANFSALAGVGRAQHLPEQQPANVTTFKIAREGEVPAVDAGAPAQATGDVATTTPAVSSPAPAPLAAAPAPAPAPAADWPAASGETAVLIRDVQAELSRRGLYDGEADGVIGPRTETAIAVFQKSVGMEPNGLVSTELVAALRVDRSVTAAVPAQRPTPDLVREAGAVDPVAAAIRRAETQVVTAPRQKVEKPAVPVPVPPVGIGAAAARPHTQLPVVHHASFDPGLVMEIQRGLSNMAYSDVTIDGVPGEQTRNAIRRFERHYKMAETGEPSAVVLKKLKSIGAL